MEKLSTVSKRNEISTRNFAVLVEKLSNVKNWESVFHG